MQLGGLPRDGQPPSDLAAGLARAAARQGHRPAVTVHRATPDGVPVREEQGFASLAQWAAKGAHLLQLDLLLEPGEHVAVAIPAGWPLAAVCAAVWWAGGVVDLDGGGRVAVVQHPSEPPEAAEEILVVGDAVDGSPLGTSAEEPWAVAVQTFPDQPPAPAAAPELPAMVAGGRTWSHTDAVAAAGALPAGTLGVTAGDAPADPELLLAVAARPFSTGRPTVVVRGVDREAATGEGVTTWR